MRNINVVSIEDVLQQAFKFFKILIFFILVNISINELLLDKDSNLANDFKSEAAYLSFYYVSFLIFYYISTFYVKLTSNTIHRVLVIRTWLTLVFTLTVFFQLSGALNPNKLSAANFMDLLVKDALAVYFIFLIIEVYHIIKLFRTNQIKWYDSIFYIIIFTSYIIFIAIKTIIIQFLLT